MEKQSNLPEVAQYIGSKELRAKLGGISPATLNRMEKDGRIPHPKRLSRTLLLWKIDEINEALNNPNFDQGGTNNNPNLGKRGAK